MGAYKYITKTFQDEYKERSNLLRERIASWRRESPVTRIERPTNVARARELGYKAKQGVVIVRVRVRRGLRKREKPAGGRKPSNNGRFFAYTKSLQSMAEERAAARFTNCEVLNSYFVGEDGKYKFFEAIMLDRDHGSIKNDPIYSGIAGSRRRVFRGLTSSGKKHRGLLHGGFGTNKNRPSIRSKRRGIRA